MTNASNDTKDFNDVVFMSLRSLVSLGSFVVGFVMQRIEFQVTIGVDSREEEGMAIQDSKNAQQRKVVEQFNQRLCALESLFTDVYTRLTALEKKMGQQKTQTESEWATFRDLNQD